MPEPTPHCSTHTGAPAAWACDQCGKGLCPSCAAYAAVGGGRAVRCVHCGGLADSIRLAKLIPPYWKMFPRFFAAIFSVHGIPQIMALAVFMYLAGFVPFIGGLLAGGVWAAYYLLVINKTSDGEEGLPLPGDFNGWLDGVFMPLIKMAVAYAIIWVPLLLYIIYGPGFFTLLTAPMSVLTDPIFLTILVFGLLYFPGAIIITAISDSVLAMLNPAAVLGLLVRYPAQYLLLTAIWLGMGALSAVWGVLLFLLGAMLPIPIIVPIFIQALSLIIPLFTAKLLGWFVYQNAEELGVARPSTRMVVAYPDAKPLAKWDPIRGQAVDPHAPPASGPAPALEPVAVGQPGPGPGAPAPVQLSANDMVAGAPVSGGRGGIGLDTSRGANRGDAWMHEPEGPLEATLEPPSAEGDRLEIALPSQADLTAPADHSPENLRVMLYAGDVESALETYRALTAAGTPLPPDLEYEAGEALEQRGDHASAVKAFHQAAKSDMTGPHAAQGLYRAGRLLALELDHPDAAAALLHHVADYFPEDALSASARTLLAQIRR